MMYKGKELEEFVHESLREFKNLSGKTFNNWYVICRAPNVAKGKRVATAFWCECKCGRIYSVRTENLLRNKSKRCRICADIGEDGNKRAKLYKEIGIGFWSSIRRNAEVRSIPFNITIEQAWEIFIKQNRKCALSGVPISFRTDFDLDEKGHRNNWHNTASLDRIDSKRDYCISNCQWVHKTINYIKMDVSQEDFISWCKKVAETHK